MSKYVTLMGLTSNYADAFFLDTTNTRLYYNGQPLDVRITVSTEIGEDYFPKKSYHFINADGEETVISDAIIPEISEDNSIKLHDLETQQDTEISDGLLSARDKFLIEAILNIFNLSVEYTYYATVNHIEDRYNGDRTTTRDVTVYQNEPDNWVYAYEEFIYNTNVYDDNGNFLYTEERTKLAGIENVSADSVHVATVKVLREADINYYSGGDLDDNKAMLSRHGGLPAGTTVTDLEKLTISEVLSEILFQSAQPEKIKDLQAYVKFGSTYSKYVEVGTKYPTKDTLEIEFIPETWQWSVNDGTNEIKGEEQKLMTMTGVTYYLIDNQHKWHPGHGHSNPDWDIYDLDSDGYKEHYDDFYIEEGDQSAYKAVITFESAGNAKDSDGNETYTLNGEEVYYAQGYDGSINSANILRFTGAVDASTEIEVEFNIIAGWRIFTNASNVSTGSLWEYKNTEPGEYLGNDMTVDTSVFAQDGSALYLQWPSATAKSENFYVYIPDSYSISSIGGAHDLIEDNWTATTSATLDSSTTIKNSYNIEGVYNKYKLSKASGITTAKITIAKN